MGSEEQYLDDLLKSMMDNEPRSMEEAMQDMNKTESKTSDFSTEDLSSLLEDLEHIEPDRPVDMAEDSGKPEEVVDAGEEEIIGVPVEEPIEKPEEPIIDVEPDELIEEPVEKAEGTEADQVSDASPDDTAKEIEQKVTEVTQDESANDSGWNSVESAETTGDTEESETKESWKSDLDELLMSMKEQDGEQEPELQDAEEKLTENLTADENKKLEKEQSEEDVTGLLDQMAGTDEDLSDINEMLKKVDNNESLDTGNADMLALLEGIKEAPSESTSATEEPDGTEDSAEDPKVKKKKEKRAKKEKKEKKPRKKLFGKSKAEPEGTGEVEGETNQENGEAAEEFGFMTDEGTEVTFDDALDSIRDKDAEAGQEKKPGILAKIWQFLTDEAEEIEDEADKGAENATGENAEIIKELDAEDSDKKKKKKGKKNKKADKAAGAEGTEGEEGENAEEASSKKKKKEKKEKKEKEKCPPEPKILTRRTTIVLVAFCATLIAAITFLSSFLPEYADKTEARRAFYAGDYQTVYEQLNNKKLGSSDEIMYQRATEILSLQHKLDSYHNRRALGEDMEALDALFQGVNLYLELAGSDTSGALDELTAIYQQICAILQNDYGVSAEEAVEIIGYDNVTYTRKLDSLLHGTEFYLPGEEPVEETPAVPEDVLPDEEAFIDMGDNV